MTDQSRPILYSFRRCPFAMRARMALVVSGQQCELREIVLRDKPDEMIAVSPKATVPVLVEPDGTVRDESLEIMLWTLERNDPEGLLNPQLGTKADMLAMIARIDSDFKGHLDRYKYANRYTHENDGSGVDASEHRSAGMAVLAELNNRLEQGRYLFGDRLSLADIAIAPFVRQFANTDADWFAKQPVPQLQRWLSEILESNLFQSCMKKYKPWKITGEAVAFPEV